MEINTLKKHIGHLNKQKINLFNTEIGQVGNQKSIYIKLGAYAKPQQDVDLNQEMYLLNKNLKNWISDAGQQLFSNMLNSKLPILRNLDWSDTNTISNANRINSIYTYFSIEFTFYFNDEHNINYEVINDKLQLILYSLVDYLYETRNLNISPSKIR